MAHESDEFVDELIAALRTRCGESFVMYNVGSYDGYESKRVVVSIPGATVIAIDGNLAVDGLSSYKAVIGATTGPSTFYVVDNGPLSSNYQRDNGVATPCDEERLEDFISSRGLPAPDALFIDTEGTTMDVLLGCGDLLSGVRFICAETQESMLYPGGCLTADVDRFLVSHGFTRIPGGYKGGGQANVFWARV